MGDGKGIRGLKAFLECLSVGELSTDGLPIERGGGNSPFIEAVGSGDGCGSPKARARLDALNVAIDGSDGGE